MPSMQLKLFPFSLTERMIADALIDTGLVPICRLLVSKGLSCEKSISQDLRYLRGAAACFC